MKSFYSFAIFVLVGFYAVAQQHDTLHFADQNELSDQTISYALQDSAYADSTLTVTAWNYYRYPLTFNATAQVTLGSDGKGNQDVVFGPDHNLFHSGLLLVESKRHILRAVYLDGQGTYSNNYYQSTQNLSEQALRDELARIVSNGYVSLGYTTARDRMYGQIDNHNGDIECVYTGTKATFNTRAGANSNGFNCEHTYPQGFFNKSEPERSDIHHLFPTTVTSNSRRGNDPFARVTGTPTWQQGGSKSGGGKFEPRDVHKGACSRAMMYFVLRYKDYKDGGGQYFFEHQENTLRGWHHQYAPTAAEKQRNDDIFSYQKNRNPFVDYPQFADRISRLVNGTSGESQNPGMKVSQTFTNHVYSDSISRYSYQFLWYNYGNKPIKIESIELAVGLRMDMDTSEHWTREIQPGEYSYLEVHATGDLNGWVDYDDSLIVKFDLFGHEREAIRIKGRWNNGSGGGSGPDGIKEESLVNGWSIYPNPVGAELFVNFETMPTEDLNYRVVSLNGQEILTGTIQSKEFIDVSTLDAGWYLLKIEDMNGEVGTQKFSKLP
ncbi:endonuclease [bacterium SCSIO 12741]|nr:endonuclease [bacterium SCSIO 12741]